MIQDLVSNQDFMVECDPERIRQVFANLLGNAVKFSPVKGIIKITTELRNKKIVFRIEDNGPGIDQKNLELIFNRFWQTKDTSSQGSGLGLSISKWIMDAHEGNIWAESVFEKGGSSFYFDLPYERI
ncbi:MAG TPA: ATP-binding protein [Bacteriovoracaceae bacterium]|nr:ATP-binding protein [Bacteriovoracaceae bacterium]